MEPMASRKIIRLDANHMKKLVRASPIKCMERIREFIPNYQFEMLEDMVDLLNEEHRKVSRKAQNINEFVGIQKDLRDLQDKIDDLAS